MSAHGEGCGGEAGGGKEGDHTQGVNTGNRAACADVLPREIEYVGANTPAIGIEEIGRSIGRDSTSSDEVGSSSRRRGAWWRGIDELKETKEGGSRARWAPKM